LSQPDGNILMCASLEPTGRRQPSQTALARFTSTGELDTTFGNQGVTIATAANGRITCRRGIGTAPLSRSRFLVKTVASHTG